MSAAKTDDINKFVTNNKNTIIIVVGIVILVVVIWLFFYFHHKRRHHHREMKRIAQIDYIRADRQRQKMDERLNTKPCTIGTYDNATDCYISSSRQCQWNVKADRCNQI